MSREEATNLAVELLQLGVSNSRVVELLGTFPHEQIRQQLSYLPYRKAKRPEALVIEAIRKNYSAPKEFFHAQSKALLPPSVDALDKGPQCPPGPLAAQASRHRTAGAARAHSPNDWLEAGRV